MQFRFCARRARGPLAVLAILVALPTLPQATGTAAAQTQPPAERVARQASSSPSPTLLAVGSGYDRREGSRRVRKLQSQLNRLGYGAGPADGLFGPRTQAAVLRFQRHQGLVLDGIVGPQTQTRLRAARRTAGTVLRGSGYAQPGGSPRVRTVQRQLDRRGFDAGPVDGLFGPRTEAAVLRFQRRAGLARDGIVGPRTRARLAAKQPTGNRKTPPRQQRTPRQQPGNAPSAKPNRGARPAPTAAPPARKPAEDQGGFPTLAVLLIALALLGLALGTWALGRRARQRRMERDAETSAAEAPWVVERRGPESRHSTAPAEPRTERTARAEREDDDQHPRAWSARGRQR